MNAVEVIYNRCSVRSYTDKVVDKATVEKLLDAAVRAPTAMNSQPWVFGVVQGAEKMKKISDQTKIRVLSTITEGSPMESYRETLEDPNFNVFYNASTLVVICAKPNVSPAPDIDCALAAENLMLMARELGLGTCWIGFSAMFLNTPEGKCELGIPQDYKVVAPIIVGYPEGEMQPREKNPPEVVFWE